jgi:hypothetical protein
MTTRIHLYDTTLRDGTQREGLSLSASDKVKIAARLDASAATHHSAPHRMDTRRASSETVTP